MMSKQITDKAKDAANKYHPSSKDGIKIFRTGGRCQGKSLIMGDIEKKKPNPMGSYEKFNTHIYRPPEKE